MADNSHYQLGIFSYSSLSSLSLTNLDKPVYPEGQKLDDTTIVNTSFEPNLAQTELFKHQSEDGNRDTKIQTPLRKLRRNLDNQNRDGVDCIEANKFLIRTPKKGILVQKRSLKQSESAYFEKKPGKNVFLDSTTSSSADRETREILPIKETRVIENKKPQNSVENEDSQDSKSPKKVTFAISEKKSTISNFQYDEIKTLPRATTPKGMGSQLAEITSSASTKKFDETTGSKTTTGFFLNQNFSPQKSKPSPNKPSLLIKSGQLSFESFCAQRNFIIRQKSEPQSIFKKEVASSALQIKLPEQTKIPSNNNLKSLSFSSATTPGGNWLTPSPLNLDKLSVSSAKITRKQPPLSHRTEGSKVRLNINDLK